VLFGKITIGFFFKLNKYNHLTVGLHHSGGASYVNGSELPREAGGGT